MTKHPLSALVLDPEVYPRGQLSTQHVAEVAGAIRAGASMPPLIICARTKRLADGFHRFTAYKQLYGEDHQAECIERNYASSKELFLDAMRYNSSHGQNLTAFDRVHCLLIAERLRIAKADVQQALHISAEQIGELNAGRIGSVEGKRIALKRTIAHMAGSELTPEQSIVNDKLAGMPAAFYVNQVSMLVQTDLIDTDDEQLLAQLKELRDSLNDYLKARR